MNAVICTLFEKHYHFGLAALVNSLHANGYRGEIYAGYRGNLPFWAKNANEIFILTEKDSTLKVVEGIQMHFIRVNTNYHLTNYKPDFMLELLRGPAKNATGIVYFDPDIVIKCDWRFFEKWMSHGVALVHEITANDMPETHPIRKEWEQVIKKTNQQVVRNLHSYINGGFCGVSAKYFEFIVRWSELMKSAIEYYDLKPDKFMPTDRTHIFFASDQDTLNIAAMSSSSPISEIGPEGMDFVHGGWTMSHAVGSPKPWKKNFFLSFLKGSSPSLAERAYWRYTDKPIIIYSKLQICIKRWSITIAAFLGRFYHRL